MLASPSHRCAVAFLRGGLLATVALLAAPRAGALFHRSAWLAPVAGAAAVLLPVAGFAAAGAFGGAALGRGRAGVRAFALAGVVWGLLMSMAWPQLTGLTGREPLPLLAAFALGAWAAAFAAGGAVAAAIVDRRALLPVAAGFALGGAAGAAIFIAPSLAAPLGYAQWPPLVRLLVATVTSIAGLLAPFGIGGAAAGRRMGREG